MQKPKHLKPKETQHSILSSVLAQFDIQTQVNKMVMRQFDTLMRTNKQAFDFIKQSEHKFIKFEQRLSRAETYYQNIEMNINSKVELTDNMNKRLEEFSVQFWQAMKDNTNEMIVMSKKFDQLTLEKKMLENRVGDTEKNVRKQEAGQFNLNEKVNEEITKVYQTIKSTQTRMNQIFSEQKHQLQQLSTNIIQSRSLLQSKSSILTQLMQDLNFYKNDRPEIMNQIQKVFEELEHRAFKLELIEMRGYVDSKIVEEKDRIDGVCMRLDTQIKVEERDRKRQGVRLVEMIKQNRLQVDSSVKELENIMKQQIEQLTQQASLTKSTLQSTIDSLSADLLSLKAQYNKQIPQLFTKISQLKPVIDSLLKDTQATSNQLKEAFSNIDSINQLISRIIDQNNQRKEEMKNLKGASEGRGNVEQQVLALAEKLVDFESQIQNLQAKTKQTVQNITIKVEKNNELFILNDEHTSNLIEQLNTKLQQSINNHTNEQTKLSTSLKSLITQTSTALSSQIQTLQQSTHTLIEQKLTKIQKQLDDLDRIQQEIRQFKELFQKQLEETEKVNASVAEKMERVMGLFTKLKSDNTVKFQQLNGELQKRSGEIKSSLNDLDGIKKYLSLSNQCLTLLLASNIFSSPSQAKQPSLNHSLTTLPQQQKIQPASKPIIKLTSILEGWILQADETQQKIKYRGQNFSHSQRPKLIQLFLEYLIKQSEKIKGSILENGKDVYGRILESGEDMFQQRKKATSKRKPSELPKLYM